MSLLPMGGKQGALDSFEVTLNLFPTFLNMYSRAQ